jgi:hypothetical protein
MNLSELEDLVEYKMLKYQHRCFLENRHMEDIEAKKEEFRLETLREIDGCKQIKPNSLPNKTIRKRF